MSSQLHVVVTGVVQGVFFRASTKEQADQLGLTGWVMNRSDGAVELVAEGERAALASLLNWLHDGPRDAEVEAVRPNFREATGEFSNFAIRR